MSYLLQELSKSISNQEKELEVVSDIEGVPEKPPTFNASVSATMQAINEVEQKSVPVMAPAAPMGTQVVKPTEIDETANLYDQLKKYGQKYKEAKALAPQNLWATGN